MWSFGEMLMRSGLRRQILLPALVAIIAGLMAILAIVHVSARTVVQEELGKRLQREVQLAAKLLDNWLQARSNDIAIWSQQEVFVEALTEEGYYGRSAQQGAQQLLATLQGGYPYYESIFLANRDGDAMVHAVVPMEKDVHVSLGDRPYFQETLQGRSVISPVVRSRLTGRPIFVITAPVIHRGSVVGVIGGVVDFVAFKEIFFDDFKVKKYGYAYLASADQQVLVSSRDNEQELTVAAANTLLPHLAAVEQGTLIHRLADSETLTVFQRLQRADWSFAINQSLDDTLRPLNRIVAIAAAGTLAVLLCLALALALLFHRVIIARLQTILAIIADIGAGNIHRRLPSNPNRVDEITELADGFNAMIARLEQTLANLNSEVQNRRKSEAALAHHQANLEKLVELRGAELKKEVLERQRAEERLVRAEKLEMIGTLAGGVAHDLNNILSGIVSYPDLLLMKLSADSPLHKPLRTIKESGEKAAAIVQDLLTLARRSVAIKEPVNLNTLIRDYLASPEFSLLHMHHPRIEVVTECAEDLREIDGAPVHLAKAIMNLVTNAAESMEQGGVIRLRTENRYVDNSLRLYERIDQGEYVVLEVIDQGSGIRQEDIDKIFEPFYTTKKMGKSGTGLGMAVVWGTVKDHQGSINCESRPGEGTTFTLYFPVSAAAGRPHIQPISTTASRGGGEYILVVDDVEEQRQIAAAILTELGYRVTTVASGEEALAMGRHQQFDLLLLDMILANGMDGLETYRQFQTLVPGQRAIIVSGFSETDRVSEALRLGVGSYLKKPYSIAKLGEAIRAELAKPMAG